jgi:cysteinyl-tRNA synthetase
MLELYNTMSRTKEVFRPLEGKRVKMFTCGPSIYRRPHVGNYRSFLWEDVLQRYLEYLGYKVQRVINLTDVEDKAIEEADRDRLTIRELTESVADTFFREAQFLKIKLPEEIPRSSTSVTQAAKLIKILLERGYAYWHDNDVFFDPLKFPKFGRLYRLDMSRWPKEKKRFRRDTYPGRRWNLGDFILWHGYKEGEQIFWDTEIGKGRPAWNVQDPAMITKHLGFQADICCGGVDNLYRHHDYNIAVIEAASGEEFTRYWVHGEHLLAAGKKMSKSRGNIVYPDDLFAKGYSSQSIRFYLIYGHHRQVLNLTDRDLNEASERLDAFLRMVDALVSTESVARNSAEGATELIAALTDDFEKYMNNDLDIKGAFDSLFNNISALLEMKRAGLLAIEDSKSVEEKLRLIDSVLGIVFS